MDTVAKDICLSLDSEEILYSKDFEAFKDYMYIMSVNDSKVLLMPFTLQGHGGSQYTTKTNNRSSLVRLAPMSFVSMHPKQEDKSLLDEIHGVIKYDEDPRLMVGA